MSNRALDNPYIIAKLEKYYQPHVKTEQLMDQWAAEAKAQEAGLAKMPSLKVAGSKPKPQKRRKDKKRAPAKRKRQEHVEGVAAGAGPPAALPAPEWKTEVGVELEFERVVPPNDPCVTVYEVSQAQSATIPTADALEGVEGLRGETLGLPPVRNDPCVTGYEVSHAKTKQNPRHRKRRPKRNREKDRDSSSGGKAAEASGSNGVVDVTSGEIDPAGGIHPVTEIEEVKPSHEKEDA